jgi:hypothetical protein
MSNHTPGMQASFSENNGSRLLIKLRLWVSSRSVAESRRVRCVRMTKAVLRGRAARDCNPVGTGELRAE